MKKILITSDFFYPHWTGISKAFFNMTKALQDEIDFTVLTVQHEKNLPLQETIEKIIIKRSPYLFTLSRAKYSVSIIGSFLREIKAHDAVLINSPCTNILFFSIFTKLFGKKLFIFHQGDLVLPKGIVNTILEIVFDVMSWISLSLADKVSTYTQDYAENSRILKPFLHKFTTLLMPINMKSPTSAPGEKIAIINQLKQEGNIICGFAGRFVEEKGFDILFQAIPSIIKHMSNIHFVFAGELNMGYEDFFSMHKDSYEKVKEHITILGLLHDDQLTHFYQNIDFMIVPSRTDCFNLVQGEAMLCHKPVLFSNIPGGRFLVQKTGFGKLFEKENVENLASQLVAMIKENETIQKNFHNVENILDNKKNIEKIKEFLVN